MKEYLKQDAFEKRAIKIASTGLCWVAFLTFETELDGWGHTPLEALEALSENYEKKKAQKK